ncbi:hypothetical protein H5410_046087 [Solanum commersonii]|uniref:Uncharacterized protein n=1 Tax=Solanum commersonii TaxID=4109 RepID=A0A9J5XDE1_SOLCO|nr:hypothetical protein H5410_046087 [Solanum commersonii]
MENPMGNFSGHKVHYEGVEGEGSGGTNSIQFPSIEDLPGQAQALLHGDKQGTPNLRTKKCQNANFNI